MSTYRWEVPPLIVLIIPGDAGRPRMTRCICLYLLGGIWARQIYFGWGNFDITLKTFLSASSSFFMEKEDVHPSTFLIPSSPAVHVVWDQPSDGCLKTSITKLKTLACVVHEHRSRCTQWAGYEHAAHMCLVHSMMAGPSSKHSQESLKLSCGRFTNCRWWRAVTASIAEWWHYEWSRYLWYCDNPDYRHATRLLGTSYSKHRELFKRGFIGEDRKGVEKWAAGGG